MRFRRTISSLVGLICLAAGLSAVTVANATADEQNGPTGGVFVPVTPARVYAWDGDVNKRPTPTTPKTFQVTGVAGIPSTGVSAVVLDVSAYSSTGVTNVYLRTNPSDTSVSMLTVGANAQLESNTAVVKPSATGEVTVAVNAQPVALTIDVQGYFTDSSVSGQAGGFVPITPARLVGTHAGFGLPKAKLNAGTTYTASIAGQADIPENATAVFANVRVVNSTANGYIQVGPAGTDLSAIPTGTYYQAGKYNDTGMSFKLGSGGTDAGKLGILLSAGQADVIIDIQGYFTADGEDGAGFTPLPQTHYYDTRSVPAGTLKSGEERTIEVAGKAGIPGDGSAGAIATTVLATNWTATGTVSLYNSDLEDIITTNMGFQGAYIGQPTQSTSLVELSADGELTLRNNSTGTVHVVLAVQGWFSAQEVDEPSDDVVPTEPEAIPCATGTECKPVLVTGIAPEEVSNVGILVDPSDGETAVSDVAIPMVELSNTDVQVDGERFTVRIDPADIPVQLASEDGVINFEVHGDGDTMGWETSTSTRVVSVENQPGAQWADVGDASDPTLQRAVISASRPSSSVASLAVEVPQAVTGPLGTNFSTAVVSSDSIVSFPLPAPLASLQSDVLPAGAPCIAKWTNQYKSPDSTIGTTYPVSGATGWMEISHASGASYGVAVSVDGRPFKKSGSSSAKGGWSFKYPVSKKSRSYRIPVKYRKKKMDCYYHNYTQKTEKWIPINEIGTAKETSGIKRPNFKRCYPQGPGVWARDDDDGKQYEFSAAVKLATAIGIDLSIKRNYDSSQKTVYKITQEVRLCGNNDDPGVAGKVMLKKKKK